MSTAERGLLLHFITGCTRLPPGGFAALRTLHDQTGMTLALDTCKFFGQSIILLDGARQLSLK